MIRGLILTLIVISLSIAQCLAGEGPSEIIVAEINGSPVYMSRLLRLLPDKAVSDASIKEALDNIITEELAFQKARKLGLRPEQRKIKNAIVELKMDLGDEGFREFLKKEGLSEEGIALLIEKKMLIEMLYAEEVVKRVVISEDDIRTEYEKEKERFKLPEKVVVVDVRFLEATEESVKRAESLLAKIKAEYNGDPWRLVQDGTFIINQLRLNRVKQRELYEEAKKLNIGGLSGIIKAPDGLHIIKLVEYSDERYPSPDEMRVYLEGRLFPDALKKREKEWREELRKEAEIKIYEERFRDLKR